MLNTAVLEHAGKTEKEIALSIAIIKLRNNKAIKRGIISDACIPCNITLRMYHYNVTHMDPISRAVTTSASMSKTSRR